MGNNNKLFMKTITSNNVELLILQYDAILSNIKKIKENLENNNNKGNEIFLNKIRDIFSNLISTLGNKEKEKEYREKTISLYFYFTKELTDACIKKDISTINSIYNNISTIKNAWIEINSKSKNNGKPINNNISNGITYGKTDINIEGSIKDFGKI